MKQDLMELMALTEAQKKLEDSLDKISKSIKARIREARQSRSITCATLGAAVNISTSRMSLHETEDYKIPLARSVQIIEYLDSHDQKSVAEKAKAIDQRLR